MILHKPSSGVCPADVTDGVYYPSSDGKPLGETPRHVANILFLYWILMKWFADVPDICPSADIFVYYEEGNPRRHVSPDLMVMRGAPKHEDVDRRRYLMWREGQAQIEFVLEVTSESTATEDRVEKRQLYQDVLRVREYFLYDPHSEYLDPPLQGFRLIDGVYQPIEFVESRLPSEVLGLHLEHAGEWLRFYNPITDEWLPLPSEYVAQAEENLAQAEEQVVQAEEQVVQTKERLAKALERAAQAQERADQTEERLAQAQEHAAQAEQRASQAVQQQSQAQEHAAQAAQRAQQAEQERERERQARVEVEDELRRLREELARLRRQDTEQTGSSAV